MGLIGYHADLRRWDQAAMEFVPVARHEAGPFQLADEDRTRIRMTAVLRDWLRGIDAEPGYYGMDYVGAYDDDRGEYGAPTVSCYLDWTPAEHET